MKTNLLQLFLKGMIFKTLLFISIAAQGTTYYSRATGNWTTGSTWSTVGCGGAAAANGPGSGGGGASTDTVVICAGNTVTFNNTITTKVYIRNLTVQSTATLTMSVNHTLRIYSLVLDGTINGNDSRNIEIGTIAGQTLSGTGFYSNTNSSSSLKALNAITILAGTDLKFNNNSKFNLNSKVVTNNGKISILNPSNFSGGTSSNFINNSAASYLVYTKQSSFPSIILTATTVGNTVEFGATAGSNTIDNTGSYYNLIITGAGTKKLNKSTVTVAGNLTINSGATLDANAKNLNIYGNWIDNLGGTFTCSTGIVTFIGTGNNQTLSPPAGATGETFYDLTINNTFVGGTVTATGNMKITSGRTFTMTAGTFDLSTYTLGQTGAAKFTMSGGDIRFSKLATTLPELTGAYNVTGGTMTFKGGGAQTIRSLNASPSNYYNIILSGAGTKTLGGNITVKGNWTNTATLAGNFFVTFQGTSTQVITNGTGETFYGLTVNNASGIQFQAATNVTVTNTLTMTSGNIDLNGRTIQVGSGAGAALSRTAGIVFGGTFKRYLPNSAITSTSGSYYGLFPIGLATDYRPMEINTSVSPATGGYVSVTHSDFPDAIDVVYNDNEAQAIQRIAHIVSSMSTSGLVGGTYSVYMSLTTLSSVGALTDLKLETYTGSAMGSVGTTVATSGTVGNPKVKRSGLTLANLTNDFVIGTRNSAATPLKYVYYSRKTGNWNDATVGNSTWSTAIGGASCNCVPDPTSTIFVTSGFTVTTNVASSANFVYVQNASTLVGTANLTVLYDIKTSGTGKIAPTAGAWSAGRFFTLTGTGASTSGASISVTDAIEIDAGTSLTMTNTFTGADDLIVNGTLDIGTSILTLNGAAKTISGSGGAASIAGASGTFLITSDKTILSGTNLNVASRVTISAATAITNQGTMTLSGNLSGMNAATSIWTNDVNSVLYAGAALLTTGVLNASAVTNVVNYNGVGAQTIKVPNGSNYNNLICSNAGTKTLANNLIVDNELTIEDNAILDASTYTLNGAGDLTMNDNSEFKIGKITGGTYPELTGIFNLNGGTVNLTQVTTTAKTFTLANTTYNNVKFSGSGTVAGSKFNFASGATVAGNFDVLLGALSYMANDNGTLVVNGLTTINCTSTASNTLSNTLTTGGLTLAAGVLNDGGEIIEIADTLGWTKNGGTFTTTGEVLFSASDDQAIGGSQSTTFNDVEIANSGATGVTLNKAATINGTLTLTAGNIVTTSVNLLTMAAGSSVTGASDDAFVNGPVAKVGSTNFTFPVGKDDEYRPIAVSTLSASGTFQAEYMHANPHPLYSLNSKDVGVSNVGSCEYWNLTRTAGAQSAFVTPSWNDYSCGVTNLLDLLVVRWNGTLWKNLGYGGTTGSTSSGTIVTAAATSSFGAFNLASDSYGDNPLPLKLLNFNAIKNGPVVNLKWSTASEFENATYTIERSKDQKNYEKVGTVSGLGNTDKRTQYRSVDETPLNGISYYRLKETDFDGNTAYSDVDVVDFNSASDPSVDVFPNPAIGPNLKIILKGCDNETVRMKVDDMLGNVQFQRVIIPDGDNFVVNLNKSEGLSSGVYIVSIQSNDKVFTKKIVIE